MKKIVFVLIGMIFSANIIYSQNAKRVTAYNYLREGKLDKAKIYIDEAADNSSTSGESKTWFYRGNIYYAIATAREEKYRNLDSNALKIAIESFKKAFEIIDPHRNDNIDYIIGGLKNCGTTAYNRKKYEWAAEALESVFNYSMSLKKPVLEGDMLFYAALSYHFIKNTEKAKELYIKLKDINFSDPYIYKNLSEIYQSEKDTAKALEILQEGRKKLVDSLTYGLLIDETNIYLLTNRQKEAENTLQIALQKDPNNYQLHYALAKCFVSQNRLNDAEREFNKAVELKPNYFDAYYDLGAMYFNEGVNNFELANKVDPNDTKTYDMYKSKFEEYFKMAALPLEKALEITPDDIYTMNSLKRIYVQTNQSLKLAYINARIKDITGDKEGAEQGYLSLLEKDPNNADVNFYLGIIYMSRGIGLNNSDKVKAEEMITKAIKYVEKANEIKKDNVMILKVLNQLYIVTRQEEKARYTTNKLNELVNKR